MSTKDISKNKKTKAGKKNKIKAAAWWHKPLWFVAKLALLLIALFAFYMLYLDSKISHLFSGQKWQIPAQIYAKSLELAPGSMLTQQQFISHLDSLQYQKSDKAMKEGQYSVSKNHVTVFRRPFIYVNGYETPQLFIVEFNKNSVVRISHPQNKNAINFARLEPQLIDHVVSSKQEDRELVQLQQVPTLFKEALLLVEDRNFYHHHGVSPLAILRAFWVNVTAGRTVQGGSTLTQQLAKNMYLTSDRTLWRKINEAMIALVLDYRFSKDQILEAYLNEVFVGQHHAKAVHGVGLGSRFYFGKPLAELNPAEYALMIGLINGPSYFDPRRFPLRAKQRRDLVLRLMFEEKLLTRYEYENALAKPVAVISKDQYMNSGYAAYLDAVKKELRQLNVMQHHQHEGVKVFTYLDVRAQASLEKALKIRLESWDKELQAAAIVADYQQAQINAMIGARESVQGGFNRAIDAKRQIGSIIKPVIYLEALAQAGRYTLATQLDDSPITLRGNAQDWQPQNFDKKFRGNVSLLDALTHSLNVPTVRLGLQVGLPRVSDGLQKLGLMRGVKLHPAALLGALDLSPLEVTQLYQTLANNGHHQQLSTVFAVTDAEGEPLYLREHWLTPRYKEPEIYLLHYALMQATKTGTASALHKDFPHSHFAGKTGTSSDLRDSWFVGFDNRSLMTVWLGHDDNKAIGLTGGSGALKVFSQYFALMGSESIQKPMPNGVSMQSFSIKTGQAQAENCNNILLLPVISVEMHHPSECIEE